ncbi:zinc-dependent metalloprotease [Streptomyces sp. NPDC058471]|uniref:zinc-dependent metalloprotease n=1 Tax=Streptomyces sp. NPDC058471 TaxID=3346516 RepID=UPI00366A296C
MPTIAVHTPNSQHKQLAQQIHEMLAAAIPLVEEATALPLPDTVSVELVSRDTLLDRYSAHIRGQVARDSAGLDLTRLQQTQADTAPQAARFVLQHLWLEHEPVLIADSLGRPTTLIAPQALKHQGTDTPDLLIEELVYALAQQAQVAASGGRLVPIRFWPRTPVAKDSLAQLSDGHATWTTDRVAPLLQSGAADAPGRHEPALWMRAVGFRADRRAQRATAFVGKAMSTIGPDAFNVLWTAPELVPTPSELRRPDRWFHRIPDHTALAPID